MSFDNLVKIIKLSTVKELPEIIKPTSTLCKQCQHGKQTSLKFKIKEQSTARPLELIHIDLCGPKRSKGLQGEQYFMLLIDDYTRMTWVCLLNKTSEAFRHFVIFKES